MKNILHKKNFIVSSRGFALTEIVIALFAISMSMIVVAALIKQVASLSKSGKQTSSIIEFTNKTTALLNNMPGWLTSMRSSVKKSDGSSVYIPCIPNSKAVASYDCPDAVPSLLAELGDQATGFNAVSYSNIVDSNATKLAGTPSSPLYLNSDGVECTGTDAATKCEFMSTGYFLRENVANNVNPGNVRFLIKLEKNPAAVNSNQNTLAMKPRFMSVDVGRAWVKPDSPADCPAGAGIVKVGYLNDGTPQCIKSTANCPAGKIQLGLDSDAQPICKAPPTSCLPGEKVILSQANSELTCSSLSPCTGAGQIFTGFYAGSGEPMCDVDSSVTPCPNGHIQMGRLPGGAPLCVATQRCPATAPLLTFNGNAFTCISDPTADTIVSTNCPAGQSVVKINPDGSAVCAAPDRNLAGTSLDCPAGHYVSGLHPNGNVKCAAIDRTLTGGYLDCPAGYYVSGIWRDGSVKCLPNSPKGIVGGCQVYSVRNIPTGQLTVNCWGSVTDSHSSFSCYPGDVLVQIGHAEDGVHADETTHGIKTASICNGKSGFCHVSTFGCFRN